MPDRTKDDRPFMDRMLHPKPRYSDVREGDIELPMPKGGKRDPKLPPPGPLEGLKKAGQALQDLKKKGIL